jgi:hypothetical protein
MGNGTLVVTRERRWIRDAFRAYEVMIGRDKVIRLRNGETTEVSLPEGTYPVQAAIDWCTSPIIPVEITAGETIKVTCAPNTAQRGAPVKGSKAAIQYIALRVEK